MSVTQNIRLTVGFRFGIGVPAFSSVVASVAVPWAKVDSSTILCL